jgi:uncharacterized membrane protein
MSHADARLVRHTDHRRHDRLDALRGFAMLWMAAYHFAFNLNFLGLLEPRQDFLQDPLWTAQRTAIVALFLFTAGAGQALAMAAGQTRARFWTRWAQIAGCALLVSLATLLMLPQNWVSFGVLHGIALMLLLVRLAAPLGPWLWPLGLAALLLPMFVQHPVFDTRWTNWVGLVTHKPVTADYVPLLPWLGVMLWGVAAGQWLLARRRALLAGALPGVLAPLAVLGRWPLSFYMLHQPLLIGVILAAVWLAA